MKKIIYLTIFLTVTINYRPAAATSDFKTSLISNARYTFESKLSLVDSVQVNTKKAGLNFAIESNAKITTEVELFAKVNLLFEEGSHLSLNDDTFEIDNALFPSFLYLSYRPIYFFLAQLGIIKTGRHYVPLLFDKADLGINSELTLLDYESSKLKVIADSKLINNNLTENRTGELSKTNSYYTNLGLDLEIQSHYVSVGFLYSKYKFNNLNYSMAQESRFMGASVLGVKNSSVFKYEYEGGNYQLYISLNQLFSKIILYSQYISNTNSNQNALLYGSEMFLTKDFALKLEHYEIESDSILAIYANPYYGRTNRSGNHFTVNIRDQKSVYSAHFYKNNTIKSNIFQDELSIFTLEFLYNF